MSMTNTTLDRHANAEGRGNVASLLRRRWFKLLLLGIVASAGLKFLLPINLSVAQTHVPKSKSKASRQVLPVGVAQVKTADVDISLNGLGTVTPLNTVAVKSRIDGQLMKIAFQEGQFVRAGEVLAEIDPRPYLVQLNQAEGQMARDQALLKNAHIDVERYRALLQKESIARQQVDTQEALVRQYEGVVKMDQALIDNARLQLDYCKITAPVSGRLGLRQVDLGNVVHANDANGIVIITQLKPINVVFSLPEDRLPAIMKRLRDGNDIPVDAYDRAGKTKLASGSLMTVDNQIDVATGTVKLKARFANRDDSLFPNQFVNARMLLDVHHGAVVIPVAAVQRGAQGPFVYAVNADKTVTVRQVTLGAAQRESVSVNSGLAPSELVVTDGADRLRDGAKVEIADADPKLLPAPGPAKSKEKRRNREKLAISE